MKALKKELSSFEGRARIIFWVAIGIVFLAGGWMVALIFLFGWLPIYATFVGIRAVVLYGNENWGPGMKPSDHITPGELHKK